MKKLSGMFLCLAVMFFAVSTFAGPVPDVVQNQCRDNTGNPIICPSSDQSFNGWDASFAINSNPNIRLDLNGNDLQVPHVPPEIMVQQDILSFYETINISSNAGATGATISGTMYQSDGVTPLTGESVFVLAFTGSPCRSQTLVGNAFSNSSTGIYTIPGLPAGTYYLWTYSDYINEWWASPLSVWDCAGAQSIVVAEGQTVTGKNFQLEPGATISGTLYQSDGITTLTGKSIFLDAYLGSPCDITLFGRGAYVNSATGTYTIPGLPAGTYYLRAKPIDNYTLEWWASPLSVSDCAGAQSIVVTEGQTVTGKNFQLEPGATISGTVYQSDGVTPLTGKIIHVAALTGSPCGGVWEGYAVNPATGTYTIPGLPAGTYHLLAFSQEYDIYCIEWWASPLSVRDCADAQSIVVTEGQTVIGKNFQLEPGATISGTVYQNDGVTPLTGKSIKVFAWTWTGSPCGSRKGFQCNVNPATGTYTILRLPAGTYYLQTISSDNYISEWWASPQSVWDCAGAQSIVVTEGQTVTGKDFQLDLGGTLLSVSPVSRDVAKDAGTTTFNVSNTGTGTMPWTAAITSSDSWLSITSGSSGTNAGTINCSFTANTSTTARTATILVTATGATGSPKDVTVTQTPTTPTTRYDFNSDGKPDILWRNTSTGENSVWYMNCLLYTSPSPRD